ncbi:MAG: c-type cytochrome [Arenicella sp.]|nr:c-type cytochrome [Arenicella sp.]
MNNRHKKTSWRSGLKVITGTITAVWLIVGLNIQSAYAENPEKVGDLLSAADTEAKLTLGRMLFSDMNLSVDGSVSCATCHDPEYSYTSSQAIPAGAGGHIGNRRPPSLLDVASKPALFWDGRMRGLERQALYPMIALNEMGNSIKAVEAYVSSNPDYQRLFEQINGTKNVSIIDISQVIAVFERSIVSKKSAFERYYLDGDNLAISQSASRGWQLFQSKAGCIQCHSYSLKNQHFTDHGYHDTAVGRQDNKRDLGRFYSTININDRGKFRTASLREVGGRKPYMHDGSIQTLRAVVEHYNNVKETNHNTPMLGALNLSSEEVEDLVAFLGTI